MSRSRAWYLLFLIVVGIAAAGYGAVSHMTFWLFVGLAWIFLALTQFLVTRRR